MPRLRKSLSATELTAIVALVVVLALIAIPMLVRSREAGHRASCQNNLKQMGLVFKMFAAESRGEVWPPISPIPGNWIPDMNALYPEYLSDLGVMICPDSPFALPGTFRIGHRSTSPLAPQCVSPLFYIYTGYSISRDEEAVAFVESYYTVPHEVLARGTLNVAIPVWAEAATPPQNPAFGQAAIPVMWDRVPLYDDEFSHRPLGGNVLHMDGHVEFVRYSYYNPPNFFPMTRISAELFSALPRLPAECAERW